jgi:hypothetical protein
MKITVQVNGKALVARPPYADAEYVTIEATCPTPDCDNGKEAMDEGRMSVRSDTRRLVDDSAYEGEAYCNHCRTPIGEMRTEIATIFGIEEDERVLNGPWKVY